MMHGTASRLPKFVGWFHIIVTILPFVHGQTSNTTGLIVGVSISSAVAGLLLLVVVWLLLVLFGYFRNPAAFLKRSQDESERLLEMPPSVAGVIGSRQQILNSWKRRQTPGFVGDEHDDDQSMLKEVTIVITDVEGSTKLWEWNEEVMAKVQDLHDSIQRSLINQYHGTEVATEGDSFTVVFHEALDAAAWALHLQLAMLHAAWPEELLSHEQCSPIIATEADGSRPGQLLFRGLRVRVAINSGIPLSVRRHHITQELQYRGQVMDLVAAMSDLPAGGQTVLGPQTVNRLSSRLAELGQVLPTNLLGAGPSQLSGAIDSGFRRSQMDGEAGSPDAEIALLCSASPLGDQRAMRRPLSRSNSAAVSAVRGTTTFVSFLMSRKYLFGRSDSEDASPNSRRVGRFDSNKPSGAELSITAIPSHIWLERDHEPEGVPLLIDMGTHWLEGIVPTPVDNMPATLAGTRLTQLISKCLSPRTAYFPRLNTTNQVSPSFFDAPCATEALLPEGTYFNQQLPQVCIVFVSPHQLKMLEAVDLRCAKLALEAFTACIRLTLCTSRGYECQERDGLFMVAFADAVSAFEWSMLLQLALLRVHWSPELLATSIGAQVVGADGQTLFCGLRARAGIFHGFITRLVPHRTTGRADYFGPPVNRAARFLSAAAAGQVLAERATVEAAVQIWRARELEALQAAEPPRTPVGSMSSLGHHASYNSTAVLTSAQRSGSRDSYPPPSPPLTAGGGGGVRGQRHGSGDSQASPSMRSSSQSNPSRVLSGVAFQSILDKEARRATSATASRSTSSPPPFSSTQLSPLGGPFAAASGAPGYGRRSSVGAYVPPPAAGGAAGRRRRSRMGRVRHLSLPDYLMGTHPGDVFSFLTEAPKLREEDERDSDDSSLEPVAEGVVGGAAGDPTNVGVTEHAASAPPATFCSVSGTLTQMVEFSNGSTVGSLTSKKSVCFSQMSVSLDERPSTSPDVGGGAPGGGSGGTGATSSGTWSRTGGGTGSGGAASGSASVSRQLSLVIGGSFVVSRTNSRLSRVATRAAASLDGGAGGRPELNDEVRSTSNELRSSLPLTSSLPPLAPPLPPRPSSATTASSANALMDFAAVTRASQDPLAPPWGGRLHDSTSGGALLLLQPSSSSRTITFPSQDFHLISDLSIVNEADASSHEANASFHDVAGMLEAELRQEELMQEERDNVGGLGGGGGGVGGRGGQRGSSEYGELSDLLSQAQSDDVQRSSMQSSTRGALSDRGTPDRLLSRAQSGSVQGGCDPDTSSRHSAAAAVDGGTDRRTSGAQTGIIFTTRSSRSSSSETVDTGGTQSTTQNLSAQNRLASVTVSILSSAASFGNQLCPHHPPHHHPLHLQQQPPHHLHPAHHIHSVSDVSTGQPSALSIDKWDSSSHGGSPTKLLQRVASMQQPNLRVVPRRPMEHCRASSMSFTEYVTETSSPLRQARSAQPWHSQHHHHHHTHSQHPHDTPHGGSQQQQHHFQSPNGSHHITMSPTQQQQPPGAFSPPILSPVVVGATPASYQRQRRSMLIASAATAASFAATANEIASSSHAQRMHSAAVSEPAASPIVSRQRDVSSPGPPCELKRPSTASGSPAHSQAAAPTNASQLPQRSNSSCSPSFARAFSLGMAAARNSSDYSTSSRSHHHHHHHHHTPQHHGGVGGHHGSSGGGGSRGHSAGAGERPSSGGHPHHVERGASTGAWRQSTYSEVWENTSLDLRGGLPEEPMHAQAVRLEQQHVPLQIQVYDCGEWTFKGIARSFACCQLVPTCLQGRVPLMTSKTTAKAKMLSPAREVMIHEVHVNITNLANIMA